MAVGEERGIPFEIWYAFGPPPLLLLPLLLLVTLPALHRAPHLRTRGCNNVCGSMVHHNGCTCMVHQKCAEVWCTIVGVLDGAPNCAQVWCTIWCAGMSHHCVPLYGAPLGAFGAPSCTYGAPSGVYVWCTILCTCVLGHLDVSTSLAVFPK